MAALITLRQRLVKIGARIGRSVIFLMAEGRGAACAVPDHPRRDCSSLAVATGPLLRTAGPGSRRGYWRDTHAQIRTCRSEYPRSEPPVQCKIVVERALTEDFLVERLGGGLRSAMQGRNG